jgi:hypothetical protein
MKISDLDQPRIGDIVEFETDPDTVVEGVIVGETEDGYIYEFSDTGYTELVETCTYGKYYCSTDKKYKCRQGPKQSRDVSEDAEPMDREFALVKKLGRLGERIVQNPKLWEKYDEAIANDNIDWIISLIQDETGATASEVSKLADLFGEIGGGVGRLTDFAWAVKEGRWDEDFMNPYRAHRSQGVAEAHPNSKIYDKCWDGYKKVPGKKRGEKGSCVEESSGYIPRNSKEAQDPRWSSALTGDVTTHTMRDQLADFFPSAAPSDRQQQVTEAEYQGREVPLGRPMRGDVKKFKVYVRDPKSGNVKKINFGHGGSSARRLGQKTMRIKKSNPARRRNFRARHRCNTAKNRMTARYWSCRAW